jgi:hypothetical protein
MLDAGKLELLCAAHRLSQHLLCTVLRAQVISQLLCDASCCCLAAPAAPGVCDVITAPDCDIRCRTAPAGRCAAGKDKQTGSTAISVIASDFIAQHAVGTAA